MDLGSAEDLGEVFSFVRKEETREIKNFFLNRLRSRELKERAINLEKNLRELEDEFYLQCKQVRELSSKIKTSGTDKIEVPLDVEVRAPERVSVYDKVREAKEMIISKYESESVKSEEPPSDESAYLSRLLEEIPEISGIDLKPVKMEMPQSTEKRPEAEGDLDLLFGEFEDPDPDETPVREHRFVAHLDTVVQLEWKDDLLFSASSDGTIKSWQPKFVGSFKRDRPLQVLRNPTGDVRRFRLAGEKLYALGEDSAMISSWDITSKLLSTEHPQSMSITLDEQNKGEKPAAVLDFDILGNSALAYNSNGELFHARDLGEWGRLNLSVDGIITDMTFVQSNLVLVSTSAGEVIAYDIQGQRQRTIAKMGSLVKFMRYCAPRESLFFALENRDLGMLDLRSQSVVRQIKGDIGDIAYIDCSEDGEMLASVSDVSTLRVWNWDFEVVSEYRVSGDDRGGRSASVKIGGSDRVAVGSTDSTISIFKL